MEDNGLEGKSLEEKYAFRRKGKRVECKESYASRTKDKRTEGNRSLKIRLSKAKEGKKERMPKKRNQ